MKNKITKRILIILGIVIGVIGLTTVSVQTRNEFIENRKAKKREEAKENKKERRKIALWVVQHFSGKEPIKSIKVGRINTHGILGSAGKSTSLIINDKKVNSLEGVDLDDNGIPNGSYFYDDDFEYTYHEKKISHVTLEGVKVGIWKDN